LFIYDIIFFNVFGLFIIYFLCFVFLYIIQHEFSAKNGHPSFDFPSFESRKDDVLLNFGIFHILKFFFYFFTFFHFFKTYLNHYI
jgi:hypothetical protein